MWRWLLVKGWLLLMLQPLVCCLLNLIVNNWRVTELRGSLLLLVLSLALLLYGVVESVSHARVA